LQSPEVEATLHYLMQDPELKFCVVTSHWTVCQCCWVCNAVSIFSFNLYQPLTHSPAGSMSYLNTPTERAHCTLVPAQAILAKTNTCTVFCACISGPHIEHCEVWGFVEALVTSEWMSTMNYCWIY
jgi:hypothetical protein